MVQLNVPHVRCDLLAYLFQYREIGLRIKVDRGDERVGLTPPHRPRFQPYVGPQYGDAKHCVAVKNVRRAIPVTNERESLLDLKPPKYAPSVGLRRLRQLNSRAPPVAKEQAFGQLILDKRAIISAELLALLVVQLEQR